MQQQICHTHVVIEIIDSGRLIFMDGTLSSNAAPIEKFLSRDQILIMSAEFVRVIRTPPFRLCFSKCVAEDSNLICRLPTTLFVIVLRRTVPPMDRDLTHTVKINIKRFEAVL